MILSKTSHIQSVHAILLFSGNYVLQLRDNKPNIAFPGLWSLFGGLIVNSETPLQSIKREIREELSLDSINFKLFWNINHFAEFEQEIIHCWFFEANITEIWHKHVLLEGQDVGIFDFDQIAKLNMPNVMKEAIKRYENQRK